MKNQDCYLILSRSRYSTMGRRIISFLRGKPFVRVDFAFKRDKNTYSCYTTINKKPTILTRTVDNKKDIVLKLDGVDQVKSIINFSELYMNGKTRLNSAQLVAYMLGYKNHKRFDILDVLESSRFIRN